MRTRYLGVEDLFRRTTFLRETHPYPSLLLDIGGGGGGFIDYPRDPRTDDILVHNSHIVTVASALTKQRHVRPRMCLVTNSLDPYGFAFLIKLSRVYIARAHTHTLSLTLSLLHSLSLEGLRVPSVFAVPFRRAIRARSSLR